MVGFGDRDENSDGQDPLGELFRALLGEAGQFDPANLPPELAAMPGMPRDGAQLEAMLRQVQQLLATGGTGPVHWELAHDVARQLVASKSDPSIGDAEQRQVSEALRTAQLWLDRVTELPVSVARTDALSRAEWVEATWPVWRTVVEPVALSVGDALADALGEQLPEEMRSAMGAAMPMMRQMSGAVFGAQLGQAVGGLAMEVLGGNEIGLPLLTGGRTVLLPANLTEFATGLGLPPDEVRLYLALREAAQSRLFAAVTWLGPLLLDAVAEYARGIRIDTEQIGELARQIDPTDPDSMRDLISGKLFEPEPSPAQRVALNRLELLLALVEGWVDEVVDAAARPVLPHTAALRESVRRRRATGGPAEHAFASLVGLHLRPRRLREAAAVWSELNRLHGQTGRDGRWEHPDLLPPESSLADPAGYALSLNQADVPDAMDAALAELLDADGGAGEAKGTDEPPLV